MLKQFQLFMGPAALRGMFIWIAATGLFSLILNVVVDQFDWVRPVQNLLVLAAIIGSVVIIFTRLDPSDRSRWLAIIAPSIGAVILALTVLPQFSLALFGAALGWFVAGAWVFRNRAPTHYQQAVKHLRKGELSEAVKLMDEVIKDDPTDPNHYRFRAELLRLNGKLDRARRDYQKMTELQPEGAVAYNGLAEVDLQAGRYDDALKAAQKAAELAPNEWVALYNLGMIEDRLGQSEQVVEHLEHALELKVPDARHRLLIHFYLTRARARLGQSEAANHELGNLRKLKHGLEEWEKILENEQAETLRAVLGADVQTARDLVSGTRDLKSVSDGALA